MRAPGLFIGSSTRAKPLASALRSRIKSEGTPVDIVEWWVKVFEPGTETLSALVEACQKCDFAAILFTHDDLLFKGEHKHLAPRDNCVFEAGLFLGGLGLNPKRCFILSSLKRDDLPSDLQGLTYLPLKAPADLEDPKACQSAVEAPAVKIFDAIQKLGRLERPQLSLMSVEELIERERPISHGGDLTRGSVVTCAEQPIELDYRFAERIMTNMKAGIDYLYFFPGDPHSDAVTFVSEMVQMISISSLATNYQNPSPRDSLKIMEEKSLEVSENLKEMQQHLSIYFLPYRPSIELLVHNAGSSNYAQCYLRYARYPETGFVKWREGPGAMALIEELLNVRNLEQEGLIFRSTAHCDLYANDEVSKRMRSALIKGIERRFPLGLHARVKEVCFGEERAQEAARSRSGG